MKTIRLQASRSTPRASAIGWLAGLLLVSCGLPPQPEPVAPISDIFRDFPELAEWGHVVRVGLRDYWQPDPALC